MASSIKTTTYTIHLNDNNALSTYIENLAPSKVFVLVDEVTEQLCLYKILEVLPEKSTIIHIDQGEVFKNIATASFIWKSLLENGADRHSLIINLGGGVIGDMGGFCASTYMRGIKFIQIPTTLLSQVDSSVGSKLGIDFNNVKNIIGVFQDPEAVIINTSFLKSLPYKQLLSGFAEILKHALIADKEMWYSLNNVNDITTLDFEDLVEKNISIKNNVVSQDPKEKGLRKILNFGHTIGHAIETILLGSDEELLHGEAIAIGMICEAYISYKKGFISIEDCNKIKQKITSLYGNKYKTIPSIDAIVKVMKYDKKNKDGKIMCSLLESIGSANYDQEITTDDVSDALNWYVSN